MLDREALIRRAPEIRLVTRAVGLPADASRFRVEILEASLEDEAVDVGLLKQMMFETGELLLVSRGANFHVERRA